MKVLRTHLLVVLLSALGLLIVPQAQAQLGIAAGANFDRISDIEGDREATFDNASGFHVGVFYDTAFGPLALRPGLFYMDIGEFERDDSILPEPRRFDLSLIEVPIDARFRLFALPLLTPYATAGPVFRFAMEDNEDVEESFNNFTVAGNVGVGVEVGLPATNLRLFPEFRYSFGLTRFVDEYETPAGTITAEDGGRLNTFMLRLGLTF